MEQFFFVIATQNLRYNDKNENPVAHFVLRTKATGSSISNLLGPFS